MTSATTHPATPEEIAACRGVASLVKLMDAAQWRYHVQYALTDPDEGGERIESLGVAGVQEKRRAAGVWERKIGHEGSEKWKRTPGYIWGPITGPLPCPIWIYLVKVSQAEMNAWVSDPDKWWANHLPNRPEGSWGFFR